MMPWAVMSPVWCNGDWKVDGHGWDDGCVAGLAFIKSTSEIYACGGKAL